MFFKEHLERSSLEIMTFFFKDGIKAGTCKRDAKAWGLAGKHRQKLI